MDSGEIFKGLLYILATPVVGLIVNVILGNKGNEINRAIQICEEAIIEKIEQEFNTFTKFLDKELQKIVNISMIPREQLTLEVLRAESAKYNLEKNTLQYIREANLIIRNLEISLAIIRKLRWIFVALIIGFIILGLLFIADIRVNFSMLLLFSIFLPLIFVVISLVAYVQIKNTVDQVGRKYGIQL